MRARPPYEPTLFQGFRFTHNSESLRGVCSCRRSACWSASSTPLSAAGFHPNPAPCPTHHASRPSFPASRSDASRNTSEVSRFPFLAGSCWGYLLGRTTIFLGEVRRPSPQISPAGPCSPSVSKATMLHRSRLEKRSMRKEALTQRRLAVSYTALLQGTSTTWRMLSLQDEPCQRSHAESIGLQ